MLAVTSRPPRENGRRDRLPATEYRALPLGRGLRASCCTFRQSCQRRCDAATPSPVGPGGLSAQLHVRARALRNPVPSLPGSPVDEPFLYEWRGWDSNPRSRAHEAREDSRSSTARRSRKRARIWSAEFEPAICVKDRHPGRLDDRGVARTEGIEPSPAVLETAWKPCPRP